MSTGSRNLASEAPASRPWALQTSYAGVQQRLASSLLHLREAERRGVLALSDGLCLTLSGIGAFAFAGLGASSCARLVLAFVGLGLAALYASDLYSLEAPDVRRPLKAIAFSTAICLLVASGPGDPLVGALTWGLAGFLAGVAVLWSRVMWARLFSDPAMARRAIVMGDRPEAEVALAELARHPQAGWAATAPLVWPQRPSPADAVVAGPSAAREPAWMGSLPPGIETLDLTRLFERLSRRIPVRFVDDRWFIEQFDWSRGIGYRAAKRTLDLVFSLIGLLLAAPLFPLIALANRLVDGGPLLYSQLRVGLNGECFLLYKFRTMRQDAEKDGAVWAMEGDCRVTRVGRFLRQTRLDEIPQLFNVLMGHMSLVGPRPERPEFVSELERAIPHYSRRHLVLPGITGWAQVRFPYGSSVDDAEEKLNYDLYYLKHRSIPFDLLILARTVSVVLNKTGSR